MNLWMILCVVALSLACSTPLGEESVLDALAKDDSCAGDGEDDGRECSLKLLQLRGVKVANMENSELALLSGDAESHGEEAEEGTCNFKDCTNSGNQNDIRCEHYRKCILSPSDGAIKKFGKFPNEEPYCQLNGGRLTDPAVYISGSEAITTLNATAYDFLWIAAAQSGCNFAKNSKITPCALLVNPMCKRGRDLLHIHDKSLTKMGKQLQKKLSEKTCLKQQQWVDVKEEVLQSLKTINGGLYQARFYPGSDMPGVFSEARRKTDQMRLAISVYHASCGKMDGFIILLTNMNLEDLVINKT